MYLITGAGGGIGSVSRSVVEELRSRGAQVRAMVHHDNARATDDVERITGQPALSVEQYVAANPQLFA
ncbi:hypothetical protein [Mycobacterium stomatepiae]|uniref:Uncharacterized protein n=1 Tax=Mycobacterium stomatepiae TaxID=470076 RepID=A0A7I7Q0Y5_9MYCO|nr:hypothetical protein [Mycobacterium stomatepiae]MCV7166307.1 hypothetical protein [Mycobacterium stomatepiae]BBY19973.1 hypothetical protein MSTO_01780 [Mycobacterium stomatepiae]